MIIILDACAMIAYLRGEVGADIVENHLLNDECHAHAINACEVYYDFMKVADELTAQSAINDLKSVGLKIDEIITEPFWMEVGKYKGNIRKISLADCFAMTLTNQLGGQLLTSDHHEFDPISKLGTCKIKFIR
jgi:predicted nucleic acid-binding protein